MVPAANASLDLQRHPRTGRRVALPERARAPEAEKNRRQRDIERLWCGYNSLTDPRHVPRRPVKLEYTIQPGTRVELPAAEALRNLPSAIVLHHGAHALRHPLGLYNTSIMSVGDRLKRASQVIGEATRASTRDDQLVEELIERYDALLDALMEHMDDASRVLLCFFPDPNKRKQHPAVKAYERAIEQYRDHIGLLVNHIKHKQGRLRLVAFECKSEVVLGYFVEAVHSSGYLGPDPRLHDGGDTAYSFNRDLRFHIASLFLVSTVLSDAVCGIANTKQGLSSVGESPDGLTEGIETVSSFSKSVYPDELRKPWPRVTLPRSTGSLRQLVIESPSMGERPVGVRKLRRITGVWKADGVSKSFLVPYLGERWQKQLRHDIGWQKQNGLWRP